MISVTEAAATRVTRLRENDNNLFLRVFIKGGGCSGYTYEFALENKAELDLELENSIIIDPISAQYLEGSIIDYTSTLSGEFFTINNPNAKTTCGCGESFGV
jgi:iron-sulfur cluster insertion protein